MKKQILISALKQFFYTLYLHLRYQLFYSHWQFFVCSWIAIFCYLSASSFAKLFNIRLLTYTYFYTQINQ